MKKQSISSLAPKVTKKYVSQSDVPGCALSKALMIAQAINDNYAKHPTKPLLVAQALDLSPTSSYFRLLTGASIAYGLTVGGYNADKIELTELGKRAVAPTKVGDDMQAMREATLKPRIVREFLVKYNNSPIPQENIAFNVLEEMGTTRDKVKETYTLIIENSKKVNFLKTIKEKIYVDLDTAQTPESIENITKENDENLPVNLAGNNGANNTIEDGQSSFFPKANTDKPRPIFIAHGKNKKPLEQLEKILGNFNIPYKVAIHEANSGKVIPQKVKDIMRECGSAIFIFTTDGESPDNGSGGFHPNSNVVFELGAASILYDDRIIIFKEEEVNLSSDYGSIAYIPFEKDKIDSKSSDLLKELISLGFIRIMTA